MRFLKALLEIRSYIKARALPMAHESLPDEGALLGIFSSVSSI
jgi:hypothetical protein